MVHDVTEAAKSHALLARSWSSSTARVVGCGQAALLKKTFNTGKNNAVPCGIMSRRVTVALPRTLGRYQTLPDCRALAGAVSLAGSAVAGKDSDHCHQRAAHSS